MRVNPSAAAPATAPTMMPPFLLGVSCLSGFSGINENGRVGAGVSVEAGGGLGDADGVIDSIVLLVAIVTLVVTLVSFGKPALADVLGLVLNEEDLILAFDGSSVHKT
jgi:hypothetical protein